MVHATMYAYLHKNAAGCKHSIWCKRLCIKHSVCHNCDACGHVVLCQHLPRMSLASHVSCLAHLLPHPYLSSPITFLFLACLFPLPIAFLCPLLSSPISCLACPLAHPSLASPVSCLARLLPHPSLASPVSCLACLLPRPSLALHISCLTPIFPHPLLSFAHRLPCPSLTSPISFLACHLPHLPLPTCVTTFPCPLLSLAHHFLLPVACLAHLLPHPSLPTCVTSHSHDSHTCLTLALTCLFLYCQPLHPSSLVHFFPHLSLALHVPSLTCCFSFLTCLSLALTHQPPRPSLLALSTPSPISFLSTPLGVSSLAPLFPHLSTCALYVPRSIPPLRF